MALLTPLVSLGQRGWSPRARWSVRVLGVPGAASSDIFAVPGQLPDLFEDTWVDAVLKDREAVRYFPQRVDLISSPMVKRYWNDVADDDDLDWEFTEKVLSSHDIELHIVKDRVFAALNSRRI